ncbi:phage Gp37/Gp68 family protein [Desulfosporosinus fructosivorans]|uniref:Phage Gp37/Gp68 family protein n=1 Tax=Desulfosporosinus fructosivorans TaxID=2018669 RepID=A0A4Z0QZM6_9FIRM|nr:phage Gp37/Gp68 family protein [Desulfosporosinus fructosivorans]TGE35910.1 phage Gp37/Gp68 family protein [Desulfosporosinus fructosivorans]
MAKTKIDWADAVWNPTTGCSKVSAGCANCYAEREWKRLSANPMTAYFGRKFNDVACHPERLDQPLRWKKPRRIFVNSMSDLFHEDVPDEFIDEVFAVMSDAGQHTFIILTKRPDRMKRYLSPDNPRYTASKVFRLTKEPSGKFDCDLHWPLINVWLGVSVENQEAADERIPLLLQTPAEVRFISAEPLLSEINISRYLKWPICKHWGQDGNPRDYGKYHWEKQALVGEGWTGLDLVITGGESGPKARPMHPDWVRSLRDQCQTAGTKFFFKQWGEWIKLPFKALGGSGAIGCWSPGRSFSSGEACNESVYPGTINMKRVGKKVAGRLIDGRTWDELPEVQP